MFRRPVHQTVLDTAGPVCRGYGEYAAADERFSRCVVQPDERFSPLSG
jgi:hypothetical protein